jgi:hypothetical protein
MGPYTGSIIFCITHKMNGIFEEPFIELKLAIAGVRGETMDL